MHTPFALFSATLATLQQGSELANVFRFTRTRPLCPYPLLARYTAGDTEAAASFACQL